MTVTLTHEGTFNRVRIDATALAAADVATVERSTDQVRWSTVRGGSAVPVSAGVFQMPVYDYEAVPNVVNYYRVRGVETAAIIFAGTSGTASDANVAGTSTLSPAMPGGVVAGDTVYVYATIRNSGTGTVNTPANWTLLASSGNIALLGRVYDGLWSMPVITFAGGVANATIAAKAFAFRSAALMPLTWAAILNASAQNVTHPAAVVPEDRCLAMVFGWKQDDWTSVATLAGMTELLDIGITVGDDAGLVIDYQIQTAAANLTAGSFVVTGGATAISRGLTVILPHAEYLNEQTASLTPGQTSVWLKSPARPFLNVPITLAGNELDQARDSRGGVFPVVGRSLPVAVTDVRGSRSYRLSIRTETVAAGEAVDAILASGDLLYLQAPEGTVVPANGVFIFAGPSVARYPITFDPSLRFTDVQVAEAAAPGPDVVGVQSNWQTVKSTYATWADLIAAKATWAEVRAMLGSADDVTAP